LSRTKADDLEQSTGHRRILQEVDDVIRIGAKLEWKNAAVASSGSAALIGAMAK
jgi:hypothetical protein